MARIVALLVVAGIAVTPAAALAAAPPDPTQSPFQQAPAPTQNQVGETPAPQQQQQTSVDNGSVSGKEALLIAIGLVALIGGIWIVIARDAKRATAGRVPTADGGLGGGSATRASRRSRRLSAAERRRRKRGRAP